MVHQLKLESPYFEQKIKGLKPWEIRLNDRDFKVGDFLAENETISAVETGRFIVEKITNVIYSNVFAGLQSGYVVMTTVPCLLRAATEDGYPDGYADSIILKCSNYGENNRLAKERDCFIKAKPMI